MSDRALTWLLAALSATQWGHLRTARFLARAVAEERQQQGEGERLATEGGWRCY